MIKFFAKKVGVKGNSLQAAIIVNGNNTPLSIVYSESAKSITIYSATDGSGVATTTVLQAIAALYATEGFSDLFDVTVGTGNGSGVLVASAISALSGGAAGAEVFTAIASVKNISGPGQTREFVDVTTHDSVGGYRQKIPAWKDAGEINLELLFDPAGVQHDALLDDFEDDTLRNYQLKFPDTDETIWQFEAYVGSVEVNAPIDDALLANATLTLTGAIDREIA